MRLLVGSLSLKLGLNATLDTVQVRLLLGLLILQVPLLVKPSVLLRDWKRVGDSCRLTRCGCHGRVLKAPGSRLTLC
jgi:hypothetical protein